MNVLVPVDDSGPARKALEFATTRFPDADITALHVIDPYETSVATLLSGEELPERMERAAEDLLAEMTELADEHGVSIETESVVGKPSQEIPAYAADNDVDQVIIGSHGRQGSSRVLLGSVAELVVRRTPAPVTVVR